MSREQDLLKAFIEFADTLVDQTATSADSPVISEVGASRSSASRHAGPAMIFCM